MVEQLENWLDCLLDLKWAHLLAQLWVLLLAEQLEHLLVIQLGCQLDQGLAEKWVQKLV